MRAPSLVLPFLLALATAAFGPAQPEPVTPPPAGPQASAAPAVPDTSAPAAPVVSAAPAAPAPTATATPAALPPAPAPVTVAFSAMTKDQKLTHMKTVILPRMGKLFQEYDAKRYAESGCATCHGRNKQDPHVVLPPLALSGGGFE